MYLSLHVVYIFAPKIANTKDLLLKLKKKTNSCTDYTSKTCFSTKYYFFFSYKKKLLLNVPNLYDVQGFQ